MIVTITAEMIGGTVAAAALVAALAASPLFRALGVAALVSAASVAFARSGFAGFAALLGAVAEAASWHADFRSGFLVGGLFSAALSVAVGFGRRQAAGAVR